MKGIRVKKEDAESSRLILSERNLLNRSYKPVASDNWVVFPVTDPQEVVSLVQGLIVDIDFKQATKRISTLQRLKSRIPNHLHNEIPQGYDLVGRAIILELPESLHDWKEEIGECYLQSFPAVQSIYTKKGTVQGIFRLRDLELIGGREVPSQVHVENNVKMHVDLLKVYFSPRLGTEHLRIANLVGGHEFVLDMFTGVGGFSLNIAKKQEATCIALDLNLHAIACLQKSIGINKLKGILLPINIDSRTIMNTNRWKNYFHRIILGLPSHAFDFLPSALSLLRNNGVIHLHLFLKHDSSFPSGINTNTVLSKINSITEQHGRNVKSCLNVQKVRTTAPHWYHVVFDILID